MNILAIETSSKISSLSVLKDGVEKSWMGSREVSASIDLLPNIKKLLSEIDLEISQLDLIAVSNGPGSFTGLRVGLAIAQGLAFSGGIKCVGVSILEVLAFSGGQTWKNMQTVTSIVALTQNSWCRQTFLVGSNEVKAQSEAILSNSNDLSNLIEENAEQKFVLENESYQKLLAELSEFESPNVKNLDVNLAGLVGKLAIHKKLINQLSEVILPQYFL